jgi:predicted AlkP superfamily pyrophosphatase or phosphodiesterase
MKLKKIALISSLLWCFFTQASLYAQPKSNVLLIGVDGLSAKIVRENRDSFPAINRMMQQGASTLKMRTVLPSWSAANWVSILTGASPELHGYTTATGTMPDLLPRAESQWGMFPGIFGLIRNKYPDSETACIYSWEGIGSLYEKDAVTYNKYVGENNDSIVVSETITYLKNTTNPLFSFVYFASLDVTGHEYGWESQEYLRRAKTIDSYVGEIVNHVDYRKTIVILISDHGGTAKTHGGKSMDEMEVPYILTDGCTDEGGVKYCVTA